MKSIFLILIGSFLILNCQVSESVGSISTSVNGISTSSNSISKLSDSVQSISGSLQSISGSSSGGGKALMKVYRMDIQDLTAIYYKKGFDSSYDSDLALVARQNGIVNWESEPDTYLGIGAGLKKANVSEDEFNGFLSNLSKERSPLKSYLIRGYHLL